MRVGTYVRRSQWEVTLLGISESGQGTGKAAAPACQQDRCARLHRGKLQKQTCFRKGHGENAHDGTAMPSVVTYVSILAFARALQGIYPQLPVA